MAHGYILVPMTVRTDACVYVLYLAASLLLLILAICSHRSGAGCVYLRITQHSINDNYDVE